MTEEIVEGEQAFIQNGQEEEESTSYRITVPAFEGPLDLLLHLIKLHKIDIYDIPILLITEQYSRYLETMEQLDIEVAADFIYMAAVLIHIKSKMLLPRDEEAEGEQEDPRAELVTRLLEYQRFKQVAETFAEVDVVRMGVWPASPAPRPGHDASEVDMSEVSLFDLIDAFRQALERFKHDHPKSMAIRRTVHKVSDKMAELVAALQNQSPIRLLWFLEGRDRPELVAVFLGMLELVRLGAISLAQTESFGEIVIQHTGEEIDTSQFSMYDHS